MKIILHFAIVEGIRLRDTIADDIILVHFFFGSLEKLNE